MSKKRRVPVCAARQMLRARGVSLTADYHALNSSDVDKVLEVAKAAGYRKSKNAPGSKGRMFYEYLARTRCGGK